MQDKSKTKQALIQELASLRQRIAELEQSESVRKRDEETLRESEERFTQMAEQAREMIWEVNAEGLYTYVSRGCELITGYNPDEIVEKMYLYDLHPEEGRESFKKAAFEVFERKERFHELLNAILMKDGREVWVSTNGIPILDIHGNLIGYRGSDYDITERKRAEEALQKSEEKYRLLAEHTTEAVWLMDTTLKTPYQSLSMTKLRGYTAEEIEQLPLDKHLTPTSLELALGVFSDERAKVVADPTYLPMRTLELEFYRKDGTTFWAECIFSLIRNKNGKPESILGEARDITDRKQAEEALRESEDRYHSLFDNSIDAILLTAPNGKILATNSEACRIFGRTEEEIYRVGRMGLTDQTDPRLAVALEERRRTGRFRGELTLIRKNGTLFPSEISSVIFRDRNGNSNTCMIIRDITERKQAEAAVQRSKENFRRSLDESPLGVRIVTVEGETIYANQAILDIYSYDSIEELKTIPVEKRYTPESYAEFRIRREKRRQGVDAPSEYTVSIVRKDGEVRYLQVFRKAILWDGERQFQVLYSDITDRKRAEEALREHDIQLKKLTSWVPGMIYQFTKRPDGTFCVPFTTEAIKDIFGCSPQDVREDFSPIARIILPEDFDRVVGSIEYSAKHLTIWTCEYQVQIPGQSIRWILGNSTPEKLADGSITWYGFNTDITDRKQLEEALQESDKMLRLITDNMSDMIRVSDLQGINLYVSPSHRNTLGYNWEDRIGKSAFDIVHPEDVERIINIFSEGLAGHGPVNIEYRVRHADGHYVWLETVADILRDAQSKATAVVQSSRDISKRKAAIEELSRSEERYRTIIANMEDGYHEVDIKGNFTFFNESMLRIMGYEREELLGMNYRQYADEENTRKVYQTYNRVYQTGEPVKNFEWQIIRKDRSRRDIEVSISLIRDMEAHPIGFRGIVRDTTDHKKAEEALRVSEERFRLLSEAAFEAIAIHEEGVLLNANDQYFKMFGYEPSEMLGKQVTPMTVAFEAREFMTIQIATGGLGPYESIGLRKDGTRFPMEIRVRQMEYKGRNVRFGAIRDITERKKAEEALRESEERVTKAFRSIPDAVVISCLEDGKIAEVNDSWHKVFGYSREEVIGKSSLALNLFADLADRQRIIALFREQGFVRDLDLQIRQKSGALRAATLSVESLEIHGDQYLLTVVQDITDRKRAEEELRTSRSQLRALATRLQQIREEERTMIAREIHDEMGGGLTGLKMDISWLLRKMSDADPCEERVALMDRIHASNELINQMIRVVRRISTDLRPSVLDDLGLIAALEWQLSEFTSRTEIPHEFATTFEYIHMEKDTAVAVFRIFQEALTNVVRHSQATKVSVVLRESERSLFGDEDIVLEIRDNGRGITEEEILNQESLGLLGMKERVLTFRGEISICGKPGSGTALILKIPRIQGEPS